LEEGVPGSLLEGRFVCCCLWGDPLPPRPPLPPLLFMLVDTTVVDG
jgi:hypothetical protein